MNTPVKNNELEHKVFSVSPANFKTVALELFRFQYLYNPLYRQFCQALSVNPENITDITGIPFLPIQCFKNKRVISTEFEEAAVFESSGTTGMSSSRHYVKDLALYRKSFLGAFKKFYGDPDQYCIIGLLPSYLERKHSSLVMMVDELIRLSRNRLSGFYLHDHEQLHNTLLHNEILKQPTLLIGVTFALLDFAEKYPMQLRHTLVMETGGMKGRREEMTRQEVHKILEKNLGIPSVHSEYGMTELLSQAYSNGNGSFRSPPWMKILIREEDDPLAVHKAGKNGDRPVAGAINVIDLANIYSCAFIGTDDIGRLYPDEQFEVTGRLDNSDIRGCSLLAL